MASSQLVSPCLSTCTKYVLFKPLRKYIANWILDLLIILLTTSWCTLWTVCLLPSFAFARNCSQTAFLNVGSFLNIFSAFLTNQLPSIYCLLSDRCLTTYEIFLQDVVFVFALFSTFCKFLHAYVLDHAKAGLFYPAARPENFIATARDSFFHEPTLS